MLLPLEFESQRQASILQALESTGGTTGANKFVKVLLNDPPPLFHAPIFLPLHLPQIASILQALESTGGTTGANKFVKVWPTSII